MMIVFGISFFNTKLTNKSLVRALLLFTMIMIIENSAAKSYVAQGVDSRQTTPATANGGALDGVPLNDTNFIYFARLNNVDGLYRFNADSKTTTLLTAVDQITNFPRFPGGGRSHAAADGLAILNINGKLYATDGTPAGTNFIRDFGSYLCCGSLEVELSAIGVIVPIDGAFYFLTENLFRPTSSNSGLWVTDGTSGGTRRINTAQLATGRPFSASIDNEESVLFVAGFSQSGFQLLKVDKDESTRLIHQFEPNLNPSLGNIVRNDNGTYFCSEAFNPQSGRRTGETSLWKISNNGVVTSIENSCHNNTLTVSAERIFYFNDQGLQSTDGLKGNARTEMTLPVSRNQRGFDSCEFSGAIYYAISDAQILEINAGAIRTIRGTTTISGRPEVLLCSPRKMLIRNDFLSDSPSPHIFDISNESFSVLRNLQSITGRTVIENRRGELFGFGVLSQPSSSATELISIRLSPSLVPPLMLLLDGE